MPSTPRRRLSFTGFLQKINTKSNESEEKITPKESIVDLKSGPNILILVSDCDTPGERKSSLDQAINEVEISGEIKTRRSSMLKPDVILKPTIKRSLSHPGHPKRVSFAAEVRSVE